MTEKQKQFEERLDSLLLLKALLINGSKFDKVTQKEYHQAWKRAFGLIEE